MLSLFLLFSLGGVAVFAVAKLRDSGDDVASSAVTAPTTPPTTTPTTPVPPDDDMPVLADSAYHIGWQGLTAEEQLVVELINRARLDPVAEQSISGDVLATASNATPDEPLAVLESLSDAARGHSQDMDDRNFFSHTNPDGDGPSQRAADEGYSGGVGENIGVRASSWTNFDQQDRVVTHHEGLWASDGHQNNLLGDSWNVIGTGYDYGDHFGYDGGTFLTEVFGRDGQTYLTGVVIEDGDGDAFYDLGEGQGGVKVTAWDSSGNAFATSTWDAGGYTLGLPPGTYTVRFEGGDLDTPYETTVTVVDDNVKLDVIDTAATGSVTMAAMIDDGSGLPSVPVPEDYTAVAVEPEEDMLEIMLF